jgi:hypothetical protein
MVFIFCFGLIIGFVCAGYPAGHNPLKIGSRSTCARPPEINSARKHKRFCAEMPGCFAGQFGSLK